MPKPYNDTSKYTNALKMPKKRQNDTKTKVTLTDVMQSILILAIFAGALCIVTALIAQKAHSNPMPYHYQQSQVKNNLPLVAGVTDNNATTKLLAAMPSRHPLAFFAPKIHKATNFVMTTGANRHIYTLAQYGIVASYDGLIRPNKKPFMGNKSSRLVTVVETRPPFAGVGKSLTKLLGVANNG